MLIHNFYYNEKSKTLQVEFSLDTDSENTYRIEELFFRDIQLYSPTIIEEVDMEDIDEEFINELLIEYYKDNEYPKEEFF
jgi:hypothetical protein